MILLLQQIQAGECIKGYTGAGLIAASGSDADVDAICRHVRMSRDDIYVDVSELTEEAITTVLNAGAHAVLAPLKQSENIPLDRLILKDAQQDDCFGYMVSDVKGLDAQPHDGIPPLRFMPASTQKEAIAAVQSGVVPIIPSQLLSTDISSTFSITKLHLSVLSSDRPDGLFATIVADSQGVALGLVYSSPESLAESIRTGTGVYHSRKRGLWYKGATSGATQSVVRITLDCDRDCLLFNVRQSGEGFCHLKTMTCFGQQRGLKALEKTLKNRLHNAPNESYTKRLFGDKALLSAKIREEADELCGAQSRDEVTWETADLLYFTMVKAISSGVSLDDIEYDLDLKAKKVSRRRGDAKPQYKLKESKIDNEQSSLKGAHERITMNRCISKDLSPKDLLKRLQRPVQNTADIMKLVVPIVDAVKSGGDEALKGLTAKFDRVNLTTSMLHAPFPESLMKLPSDLKDAIDLSFENIRKFHNAQLDLKALRVETMPGVVCSRFARSISRVGLYVPGGTAVLPSTAMMLGVPAMVAGCQSIIYASPPQKDGTINPETVYIAHKVGAKGIVMAGGAQAIAAMAYGTESIPKVDKLFGPGNQFVTAAKMHIQNDVSALVSIDMPAGPSEVLVIADKSADPAFVASDLLSQAEHGADSQVVLIAVAMSDAQIQAIEDQLHEQALALPRVEIIRKAISHSVTFMVDTIDEAVDISNQYAPEHLILQLENAATLVPKIANAGSVFVGHWSPESCGDYSSGTNHVRRCKIIANHRLCQRMAMQKSTLV